MFEMCFRGKVPFLNDAMHVSKLPGSSDDGKSQMSNCFMCLVNEDKHISGKQKLCLHHRLSHQAEIQSKY